MDLDNLESGALIVEYRKMETERNEALDRVKGLEAEKTELSKKLTEVDSKLKEVEKAEADSLRNFIRESAKDSFTEEEVKAMGVDSLRATAETLKRIGTKPGTIQKPEKGADSSDKPKLDSRWNPK